MVFHKSITFMPLKPHDHHLERPGSESLGKPLGMELFTGILFSFLPAHLMSFSSSLQVKSHPFWVPFLDHSRPYSASLLIFCMVWNTWSSMSSFESKLEWAPRVCWNIGIFSAHGRDFMSRTQPGILWAFRNWVDDELVMTQNAKV